MAFDGNITSTTVITFLGFGTMGSSIAYGLLQNTPAGNCPLIYAVVSRQASIERVIERFGTEFGDRVVPVAEEKDVTAALAMSDICVLCTKPWVGIPVLQQYKAHMHNCVLISVMAGTKLNTLSTHSGTQEIVRAMPNTPSQIMEGMTILIHEPGTVSAAAQLASKKIFEKVGRVVVLEDEAKMDAATALAGSGPAFVAMFIEAMIEGGLGMGLPRPIANELVAQTVVGAAKMVQNGQHPALVKDSVATPGGCTVYGILKMEQGNLRSTVSEGIRACAERAEALGRPKT